jgi:hypothetical protein
MLMLIIGMSLLQSDVMSYPDHHLMDGEPDSSAGQPQHPRHQEYRAARYGVGKPFVGQMALTI